MTKEKMHQNAEERLELLHTITEIVNIEVEKRMDTLTAQKQQGAPKGKCSLGRKLRAFVSRFRIRKNQKNNSITISRGCTAGAEARDTSNN